MTLRLFNTLTKTKEDFAPLDPKNVRMYVCGPTVYDFAHIGNARPVIVFDVLFRLLRHLYGDAHVTYVRNITDVDDKINARAAERGISHPRTDGGNRARSTSEDVAALGNLPPTVTPRATEHIARDDRDDRRVDRGRPRLCGGWPCAVRCFVQGRLRQAGAPFAGRDDGRRAGGSGALQEERHGFCVVEAVGSEPAGLGFALGPRPPRLAYRMLGHGGKISGRDLRHPWRRHRSGVSPSRKRNRPERRRASRPSAWRRSGCTMASCRWKARKCPRAWAISSPSASFWPTGRARCCASTCCAPIIASRSISPLRV